MDVKDIDFDELDRAVNSAIAKDGSGNIERPVVASITPTSVVPIAPTINSKPLPTTPVPASRPTISRPATGRFMDVVHPSTNMRVAIPERPALRPLSSSMTSQPSVNPAPTSLNNFLTKDNNADFDIDKISDEINKTLKTDMNEAQDSPFLPDAKVEKRPLNAFTSEQNANVSTQLAGSDKAISPDVLSGGQEKIDTPLPAELQNDLLSIEAAEVAKTDEAYIPDDFDDEDEPETPEVSENPVGIDTAESQYIPVSPDKAPTLEEKPVVAPTPTLTNPIAATSIPQQYTELPNTGDKEIGSIYDTNSYHKAMTPPAKKKSGWMWVIWIALLMIVSVGAGVAVYFFVLPQL